MEQIDMPVKEHAETINIKNIAITPDHVDRVASKEFAQAVRQLKQDGHYVCFVSGRKDGDKRPDGSITDLQVHHLLAEWSMANIVDMNKLKALSERLDPYGYGKVMTDVPLTTVDDIRNMLVLDQPFHTGTNDVAGNATGIHNLAFPMWVMQLVYEDNDNPIPQKGETIQNAEDRIEIEDTTLYRSIG